MRLCVIDSFCRHSNPPFGFFILNRNGVENFSAHITPQDDLELTPQFIIYQSAKGTLSILYFFCD